jgi:hypothetical protein
MKVRCVKILDARGNKLESSPWLSLDGVYDVLSIYIEKQGRTLVRLIGEQSTPALFSLEEFEIVDGSIPRNWTVSATSSGNLDVEPDSWKSPGFWDRYYDGDGEAQKIFDDERLQMNAQK